MQSTRGCVLKAPVVVDTVRVDCKQQRGSEPKSVRRLGECGRGTNVVGHFVRGQRGRSVSVCVESEKMMGIVRVCPAFGRTVSQTQDRGHASVTRGDGRAR